MLNEDGGDHSSATRRAWIQGNAGGRKTEPPPVEKLLGSVVQASASTSRYGTPMPQNGEWGMVQFGVTGALELAIRWSSGFSRVIITDRLKAELQRGKSTSQSPAGVPALVG